MIGNAIQGHFTPPY